MSLWLRDTQTVTLSDYDEKGGMGNYHQRTWTHILSLMEACLIHHEYFAILFVVVFASFCAGMMKLRVSIWKNWCILEKILS